MGAYSWLAVREVSVVSRGRSWAHGLEAKILASCLLFSPLFFWVLWGEPVFTCDAPLPGCPALGSADYGLKTYRLRYNKPILLYKLWGWSYCVLKVTETIILYNLLQFIHLSFQSPPAQLKVSVFFSCPPFKFSIILLNLGHLELELKENVQNSKSFQDATEESCLSCFSLVLRAMKQ